MVSRAVTQLYDDILRPSGLRVTQFSVLATIACSGEANLRQLEAGLAFDQTTLTRSLTLLQRDRDRTCASPRRAHQGRAAHAKGQTDARRGAVPLGPGTEQGAKGSGHEGLG